MEPGGEPQRLDGLPRLLFLQRSCSEGRKWADKQDAGGGMATLHPLGGRVSSKRLSSISICQGEQPAPRNSEPHEALCPFYMSTQADRRLWGYHPSHDQLVTEELWSLKGRTPWAEAISPSTGQERQMLALGRNGAPTLTPRQARTALRSGACGLEGLTGTESPAADGMYKTGPGWVGLDTAEEGCRSSLRGGSARDRAGCQPAPEPAPALQNRIQVPLKETTQPRV